MKINRLKTGTLLLLGVLIFFSCQTDEQAVENDNVYTGKSIAVSGQTHQKTRTTLKGFSTEWIAGDQIGVYSPQSEATNEQYTAESSAAFSAFDGNMSWGTGTHSFYAYYPYTTGSADYTTVPIALTMNQTQSEGGDVDHLAALDFMIAQPLTGVNPGENVQFQFEHLFTLLEFRVVGSGNLSKIELVADAQTKLAFASGSIDISQAKPSVGTAYSINYSGYSSSTVALTLGSPVVLTNDDATTPALYMMVNPIDLTGQEISVTVTIDGVEKTITSNGFNFNRGQKYTLVVDKDIIAQGTAGSLTWMLTPDGILTISGNGELPDYSPSMTGLDGEPSPWRSEGYLNTIREVVILDGVTSIGDGAFYDCVNLAKVTVPNSVTSIRHGAFANCSSLTTINLKDDIQVAYLAFYECSSLKSGTIGALSWSVSNETLTLFGAGKVIDGGYGYNPWIGHKKNIKKVIVDQDVISLGNNSTFTEFINLTEVEVDANNPNYASENGTLLNKAKDTFLMWPQGDKNPIIPDYVTTIGSGAFSWFDGLTRIVIPDNVKTIESSAFGHCVDLTEITIGKSVESIAWNFYNSPKLMKVTIMATTPPYVMSSQFDAEGDTLYVPKGCLATYQNSTWATLFSYIVEQEGGQNPPVAPGGGSNEWGDGGKINL